MKTYLFVIMIILSMSLYACETSSPADVRDAVIFNGVGDVTLAQGQQFDPLEGVSVFDVEGRDLTEGLEVEGTEHLGLDNGRLTNVGTFILLYRVEDREATMHERGRAITVTLDGADPLAGCGQPVIGDYVITWCDEFTGIGAHLNAQGVDLDKWAFQTGTGSAFGLTGWGNNEAQYYREENARVENGRLIIEARRENHGGQAYTSARLWTKPTFYQRYGRFEARIRLPIGEGLWPAFWMMPQYDVYGTWAASGEIDIMEARGRTPNQSIAALHFGGMWPHNTHTHATYQFPSGSSIQDFNVYAIEWEEGEIRWYVNDHLIKRSTQWHTDGHAFPAPFDQEFYLLLNLAIGGTFDGGRLPPNSLFDQPVIMEIDYVRVYQIPES